MNGFALLLCSFTNAIMASESASVLLKLTHSTFHLKMWSSTSEINLSKVFFPNVLVLFRNGLFEMLIGTFIGILFEIYYAILRDKITKVLIAV